jgi:hypothetical protein
MAHFTNYSMNSNQREDKQPVLTFGSLLGKIAPAIGAVNMGNKGVLHLVSIALDAGSAPSLLPLLRRQDAFL